MDVGHHCQLSLPANRPEFGEVLPAEHDDARVQGMRIEVIVENEIQDPCPIHLSHTKEKGTAFASGGAAPEPQPCGELLPKEPTT